MSSPNTTVTDRTEADRAFWVPKRRVAVRVQLADRRTLVGDFYVDLQGSDTLHSHVRDRLGDPLEKYVPLAMESQHVLLNTGAIVVVEVARGGRVMEMETDGLRELRMQLDLRTGTTLRGSVYASLPSAHSRTLDYLNHMSERFVSLHDDHKVTLVNADYVVGVTEVTDLRPLVE